MNPPFRPRLVWSLALGVMALAGCQNIFQDISTRNTNDAYLEDARAAMNDRDYTRALTKLLATTETYQARREVILAIASAYAGRCGLDVLALTQAIVNAPTQRLFPLLLGAFKGATTGQIADCGQAQTWVRKLAPGDNFALLTADESLFLAVASIARVGAILSTFADLDLNGVVDPSFDACNTTKLPDAPKRDVGVALNLTLAGLKASGNTQLAGSTGGVASTCAALPAGQNFCGVYDPAGFTAPMVQLLGGVIGSQDLVGLGSCAHAFPSCICP